jgi:hypothetical protein
MNSGEVGMHDAHMRDMADDAQIVKKPFQWIPGTDNKS